jgi:hypothetical protein
MEGWEQGKGGHGRLCLEWNKAGGLVQWARTQSRSDGGSIRISRGVEVDVSDVHCLLLGVALRVDSHSLKNSGWCSDRRGGSGEYPVHIRLDYLDEKEKPSFFNHGFLTTDNDGARRVDFTRVPKKKWIFFGADLMDPQSRKAPDPGRPDKFPRPPCILGKLHLYGNGWDFKGAVNHACIVAITFKNPEWVERWKKTREE